MKQQDIEKLENYFIKKNRNFAIDGISRNTMKNELLLSDGEVEKYLKKRMFYSIGEAIELLIKINNDNNGETNVTKNRRNKKQCPIRTK